MSPADTVRLLLLSSLWSFSFICMRVAVPEFGPVSTLAWGVLLLGESLSLQVVAGMVSTLLGTAIATGVLRLRRRRALSS